MIETYIPLYRKYRPQTFADLIGQEAISQTLGNAIALNKVAHAYLFCGPRGTGKTSTARIFAKSLNCEQGPTVTPCLQCASCQGITQGNALDVIEFDAASNNGVGDARELIENCQYTSMTGRFKVYIIDEVHMLTTAAFNALLKTLEEPPPNVIFIFATTEAHKVLPTIISRCQRFDFNRITTEDIVGRLRHIAELENIAIDEEALLMIGRHARGGLRDAVGLLDQVAVLGRAQQDKVIGRKDVALFIGALEEDLLLRLGAAIAERRAADLLHELTELINRGIEPIQLIKDLTAHFRNLLLVQAAGGNANPDLLSLPRDYFGQLAEQAALFAEPEEIPQVIARFSFIERNVRNSNQPQLWLEVGLIELAYRHEIHRVKDLSERVAALEARLSGQGAPLAQQPAVSSFSNASPPMQAARPAAMPAEPPPRSAAMPSEPSRPVAMPSEPAAKGAAMPAMGAGPPSAIPPLSAPAMAPSGGTGSLQESFRQITSMVSSLATRALLQQQSFPIRLENDQLIIGCSSEPTLNLLKKPDKFIHLQKAVNKYYGREIKMELILEKKPVGQPAMPISQPAAQPQPVMAAAMPAMGPMEASAVPAARPAMQQAPEPSAVLVSRPPAMPAMPEAPSRPPAMPAQPEPVRAIPAFEAPDDEPPPMEDAPPLEDSEPNLPENVGGSISSTLPSMIDPAMADDPDLAEAKKYAVELLQGKVLD